MPEETKPVEREAFEKWAKWYGGMSLKRDADGIGYDIRFTHVVWESWQASAAAALERAAQVAQDFGEDPGNYLAEQIRALKGRE